MRSVGCEVSDVESDQGQGQRLPDLRAHAVDEGGEDLPRECRVVGLDDAG